MTDHRRRRPALPLQTLLAVVVLVLAAAPAGAESYAIDAGASRVVIHVGKTGLFGFIAGHTHEVVGPIGGTIDRGDDLAQSRLRVTIDSAALKVSPDDEPAEDVPKVQATMDDQVLDVSRYPMITFDSTSIAVGSRRGNVLDLTVTGRLTLRGVSRTITVPVHAIEGADGVSATGRFQVKQTDYGIRPISVAGVVKVKDELDIRFTIDAHRSPASASRRETKGMRQPA